MQCFRENTNLEAFLIQSFLGFTQGAFRFGFQGANASRIETCAKHEPIQRRQIAGAVHQTHKLLAIRGVLIGFAAGPYGFLHLHIGG